MRGISIFNGLVRQRRVVIHLSVLVLMGVVGCYSPGRSRVSTKAATASEAAPPQLGRIGLLVPDEVPAFTFRYPKTPGDAMFHTAEKTWDFIDLDDGADQVVAGILISGVSGVIGGAITGVPLADIQRGETAMLQALREHSIIDGILSQLRVSFADAGYPPPVVIPPNLVTNFAAADPSERDYGPLKALGVDSVMELSVESYGFRARERSNPPMKLGAKVAVRVTRLSDTNTLVRTMIRYHGHQHRFMRWAADDAQQFRSDLKRIGRMVGRNAVECVLPDPGSEPQ